MIDRLAAPQLQFCTVTKEVSMTSETYQDVLAAAKRMPPAAQAELVAMSALQRTSHARRRVDSAVLCPGISLLATLHGRLCTSDHNPVL
jgi:hypothetical protein